MGRALPNFRELAALEAQDAKMVEMVQRFERERRDQILEAIQGSKDFTNLFAEVANLYGPVLFESIFNLGNDNYSSDFFIEDTDQSDDEDDDSDNSEDDDDIKQIPPHDSSQ